MNNPDTSTTFGKYCIKDELGRGGFATVYRAIDTSLDREVALKVLHPQLLIDQSFVSRFFLEARTIAKLRHHHIITIYEISQTDGRIFIVMNLAEGGSLGRLLTVQGRQPWGSALKLLHGMASGLDYAHHRGVIHRDLKPANILLTDDLEPLVSDFGFARLAGESSLSMSVSSSILGTPSYIAPEVWANNTTSQASDIYAFACIAYEVLTGRVLFAGETPIQVMRAHDNGPSLAIAWPEDVPAGVEPVLRKALSQDPGERYATAMDFWQALDVLSSSVTQSLPITRAKEDSPTSATPVNRPAHDSASDTSAPPLTYERPEGAASVQRNNKPLWLAGIGLSVLIVIGLVLLLQRQVGRAPAAPTQEPIAAATQSIATVGPTSTLPAAAATTPPAATASPAAARIPTEPYGPALSTGDGIPLELSSDGDLLAFKPGELTVKDGLVTLTFNNSSSAVQHSFVLVKGGYDVADAVNQAAQDRVTRQTGAVGALPPADTPGLLVATQFITAGDKVTVTFKTPGPGTYTFLCTFPGHYLVGMTGTLTVQ